jgi:muramidase (phage lysozyme)
MNKMLTDKHSLLTGLRKGKGDQDLEDIRTNLTSMLGNLRFQDGRSLEEMFRDYQKKEQDAKD